MKMNQLQNNEEIKDIIRDLIVDGNDIRLIKKALSSKYEIDDNVLIEIINQVKSDMLLDDMTFDEVSKAIQMERLNYVYRIAKECNNTRLMLQVTDQINKLKGLYETKVNANVNADFTVEFS